MTSDDGDSVDDSSAMDSSMSSNDDSSDSSAFITILSTGAYRVKGKVNEQNRDSIVPGESVIIRSRVDSSKTWKGTMGSVDVNNGTSDDSEAMICIWVWQVPVPMIRQRLRPILFMWNWIRQRILCLDSMYT